MEALEDDIRPDFAKIEDDAIRRKLISVRRRIWSCLAEDGVGFEHLMLSQPS
jgi:hypothetical protein